MQRTTAVMAALVVLGAAGAAAAGGKWDVRAMSDEKLVKLALSAAPDRVAEGATVVLKEKDGTMRVLRQGDNGFTCMPFIDEAAPGPDPICMDGPALQWGGDMMSGKPAPSNTVPGVAYMANGGYHWEKDGQVVTGSGDGARAVKESPHWMILFPFDPEVNALPTLPNKGGTWVMFGDTAYSHLMIHQDPRKMR
ncbi:MAG: hypothetical protein OEY97_04195 [Nitrospirota bacterium]|nr:hypothetical protein [Nitrospirota bacterium]